MANTLTALIPDLYESLDVVSRELTGFIPAVTLDASAERAAVGQTIRIFTTPAATAEDVTPGQLPPDDGDQSIGNVPFTISKSRMVPFRWTGEEQKGVNTGSGYAAIRQDQIKQAMRTLVNEIESDLASLAPTVSRSWGTPGTTPFATDLSDPANVRKIISDNGGWQGDMQLVFDTTCGAKVRSLAQLTKANEAGTTKLREQGILLDIHGFSLRESAGIVPATTVGSVTGTVTASGSKGATGVTINTAAGASVAILAGDIVQFNGDSNKYTAAAALTLGASTSGTLTLVDPGLRTTISTAAVTVAAAATRNMAFPRSSLVLATRAPALPEEGDMAEDRMLLVDERSGLVFEVSMYKQYRRVRYEIAIAWGKQNIKPRHTAGLLG